MDKFFFLKLIRNKKVPSHFLKKYEDKKNKQQQQQQQPIGIYLTRFYSKKTLFFPTPFFLLKFTNNHKKVFEITYDCPSSFSISSIFLKKLFIFCIPKKIANLRQLSSNWKISALNFLFN